MLLLALEVKYILQESCLSSRRLQRLFLKVVSKGTILGNFLKFPVHFRSNEQIAFRAERPSRVLLIVAFVDVELFRIPYNVEEFVGRLGDELCEW